MRAWDIQTAEQCGILERCQAFEKELREGVYRNMSKIKDKARELEKKRRV